MAAITFSLGRAGSPLGNQQARSFTLGASQTIACGDMMVLTLVSSKTYVRKLTATDITNHFSVSSLVVGVLGTANYTGVTDSNGNATGTLEPSTVAWGAYALLPIPNYAASLDTTIDGRPRMLINLATGDQEFNARTQAATNAAVTVTQNTQGAPVGIQVANTTGFAWNTSSTSNDICGEITFLLEQDPNFNVSSTQCVTGGKILGLYSQISNGQVYTS